MMKRIAKIQLAILLLAAGPTHSIANGTAPTRQFKPYSDRVRAFFDQAGSNVASNCDLADPKNKGKRDTRATFTSSDQTLVYEDYSGDCKFGTSERIISYTYATEQERVDATSSNFQLHTLNSITIVTLDGNLTCSRDEPECVSSAQKTEKNNLIKASTTDPCSISNSLADQKKYGCKKAKQVNEYAEAGTTILGAVTTQMIQAQNTNTLNTLSTSTNAGDANRAVADTAQRTANQQKTMAGVRGVAAMLQAAQMQKYQKNAAAIQTLITNNTTSQAVAQGLIPAGQEKIYNSMSESEQKVYLTRVKAEQLSAKDMAKTGLITSVTTVAASTANAINSDKIARDQNAYAQKMDDIAKQQQALLEVSKVQVSPTSVPTFAPYVYNNTTNVNGGNDEGTSNTDGEPNLTTGGSGITGPAQDGATPNEVATLPYSALKPGAGDANKPAAGGGGGGGAGGGAGGAPQLGQEDRAGGSTLVMNGKGENYDSIGKSKTGAGGATAPGAAVGGGDGLDINSMLAKFLPGAGGNEEEANNGILDYAKREPNRAPANEAPVEDMILDRGADLFQRVSATYRDKLEKKEVGI